MGAGVSMYIRKPPDRYTEVIVSNEAMQCIPNVHMQRYQAMPGEHVQFLKLSAQTISKDPHASACRLQRYACALQARARMLTSPRQHPGPVSVYSREPRAGNIALQAAAGSPVAHRDVDRAASRQTLSCACPGLPVHQPGAACVLAKHACGSEAAIRAGALGCSALRGLALRALEWRVARRICDDALHGADGRGDGDNQANQADGLRMRTHTPQSPQGRVLQSNNLSPCAWQRRRACIQNQVPDQRWTLFCTM